MIISTPRGFFTRGAPLRPLFYCWRSTTNTPAPALSTNRPVD
ncbi:hypothetical protein HMPREF0742_02612 [Rothia aeria F0184]|uniref:Uncharacterized protein n=1 Tax=Rothia aeria F0184 TaxID=888019 RepID=U7UWR9_9MICC|nr:hypothetical protein HMPREF0742_02612 [Rothia aeria F0184]